MRFLNVGSQQTNIDRCTTHKSSEDRIVLDFTMKHKT